MKGFVINLDRRPDRYTEFVKNFKDSGIEITRVSAIDSKEISFETPEGILLKSRTCDWNFKFLPLQKTKNVVACCLSHQLVWKKISEMESEVYVYVFEDDCEFIKPFDLKTVKVPKNFGIVWLNRRPNVNYSGPFSIIQSIHSSFTTESYIITPRFAKRMLEWMTDYLGAVDAHMDQYINALKPEIVSYEASPPIFCQSRSPSDIQ